MTWRRLAGPMALLACCGVFAACGSSDEPTESADKADATATASPAATSNTGENNAEFFDQATMDKQLAQRSVTPEGPADQPWLQMIEPEMRDTADFKSDKSSGWNVCFSNAGNNNPWRQNGLKTMEAEAKNTTDNHLA